MVYLQNKEITLIIYGRNSVDEALIEKLELKSAVIEKGKEDKFENLIRRLIANGVKVSYAHRVALDKLAQTQKHQGIAAEITLPPSVIEDGSSISEWQEYDTILALDGITDTGNLGAIIRSALLFQCGVIVLPKDNSARITPQTIKSSAGALYKQKVVYLNSLNTFVEQVQSEDFTVYGLTGDAESPIGSMKFPQKVCLIIGSEREGIRKSLKKKCDHLVRIPTTRKVDSLNASVASAIALWEVYRNKL
jgi:23S rRNA (guanosine2251-2'-O)-methyltransferase